MRSYRAALGVVLALLGPGSALAEGGLQQLEAPASGSYPTKTMSPKPIIKHVKTQHWCIKAPVEHSQASSVTRVHATEALYDASGAISQ